MGTSGRVRAEQVKSGQTACQLDYNDDDGDDDDDDYYYYCFTQVLC